ncbi:flagellar hook-length control protein FliK [Pseudaeromonas pectinilytica]
MMQVNSKITLEAPQESLGGLSRSSAVQGENNFSAVLEAKTTAPQRQSDASKPAHPSKAAFAGVSRAEVKPQEPGVTSAANKPRADTNSRSAAVVDAASSPRTDAKPQDKAAVSAATTTATAVSVTQDIAPEAGTVETDSDVLSEQERALISNPNMQDKKAVNIADSDALAWGDMDAAAEASAEVMDPALLSSEALSSEFWESGAGADHVKIAGDPLLPETESTSDASPDSEAAAIDFLQHLQNSLATNTQVVIPKANLQTPDLAALTSTDPTANGDPVTSNTESSGKFLPPSEVAASSSDVLSSAESKLTEEGFSQWLDELVLPAEPMSSPSEPPASSDVAAPTAGSAAKSGVQAFAAAVVQEGPDEAVSDAGAVAVAQQPERGEHASELAQLAALLAGGGKREGASPATAEVSEAVTTVLGIKPESSQRSSELAQLAALLAGGDKREGASPATAEVSEAVTTVLGMKPESSQRSSELAQLVEALLAGGDKREGASPATAEVSEAVTTVLGIKPESSQRSSELAQLAALLAGGGKREGASPATALVSETAVSALVRAPLETTAGPTTELAFSLNSIMSSQTSQTSQTPQASGEEVSRDEFSLQANIQPDSVRSVSTGTISEMHALLGETQGSVTHAVTSAAITSTAAAQEALSRSRETPVSLAAVHLGLPQQAAPELAARMTLMMGQKWHEAEIQLEPQGLGKMSIQLSIDQDQKANVQFIVQHGSSRELLEQALPKLRDMLASQGIQLGQTNVQQQSAGQQQDPGQLAQQGQGQGNGSSSPWRRGENSLGESVDVQNLVIRSTDASGIDFYA